MPKWLRPTLVAVLVFVALFTCMSVQAEKAITFGYSLGAVDTKGYKTQNLGLLFDDAWYFEYERFGGRPNDATQTNMLSAGRRFSTTWGPVHPFLGLGASYSQDKIQETGKKEGRYLVNERLTFQLKAGVTYHLSDKADMALSWNHNSTGGRSKPNSGIDRVRFSYTWRF